ncbi:hypothetical protein EKN38_06785 [Enterobacter sp. WCHEn045836]|nr:hypothetical protein EKN38_06785 [Enterobacter sp. WCHEn045836]
MTQIDGNRLRRERGTNERSKDQRFVKHKKPSTKITFHFYETAVYFLIIAILVSKIVIICFIFFGTNRRDIRQQTRGI